MYIPGVHPDKDSWTYTALFEINKKNLEMIIASMSARVTTNQYVSFSIIWSRIERIACFFVFLKLINSNDILSFRNTYKYIFK